MRLARGGFYELLMATSNTAASNADRGLDHPFPTLHTVHL